MDLGIAGKRALVMGASSGLGQAVAISLAAEGVKVLLAGRRVERLQVTADMIRSAGGVAEILAWDLMEIDAIERRHEQAVEMLNGSVEILFNNGGGPAPGSVRNQTTADWRLQFDSLVMSVIKLTDAVLPDMQRNQWGRVITNASSGVVVPIPNLAMSNTLRSALVGWSKTLANEVAAFGVTVNMVLPGRIATDRIAFLDAARAKREGVSVGDVETASRHAIPVGRYGRPEEYADFVTYLASERASYITGSIHRVDGGAILSV